jgi:DNA-binding Lrp family transcriptional regulator
VPPRRSAQPAGRARRGHRKLNTCRKIETTHAGIARYLNLFEAMPEVLGADRVTGEDSFIVRCAIAEPADLERLVARWRSTAR